MVDPTIPLTTQEWEEWGNPNEEKFFEYIMSYSPMNNIKPGVKYPACLLSGGLHDPRVQYWEPLKFAAELRHVQNLYSKAEKVKNRQWETNRMRPVCVKINMSSGHFAAYDRYKYLEDICFDYAFLLDQLHALPPIPRNKLIQKFKKKLSKKTKNMRNKLRQKLKILFSS